ncbi:MAG: class F sortase [Anaerolineae bacterium]|nr:MAG: class F sortase [Anaerolineae bacterium]
MAKSGFRVLISFGLCLALLIATVPQVFAATTFTLSSLSGQDGWDGGIVAGNPIGFAGNVNIINTDAHIGSQSWRYAGGSSSPGAGTAFSPAVSSVGSPDQGGAGDRVIISFAFKAANPGDGSRINMHEGAVARDDRTGNNIYLEAVSATQVRVYMNRAIAASPYFQELTLGYVDASTWHVIELDTTYAVTDSDDLTTWGLTTYTVDGVVLGTETPWAHWWRHKNGYVYAPGSGVKFASTYNDGSHAGFFVDDVSIRVIDNSTHATLDAYTTSFEATGVFPATSGDPISGTDNAPLSQITVVFDADLYNPAGNSEADDVTNPDNYLLFQPGPNAAFDTVECSTGLQPDDVQVSVDSVAYSNGGGSGPFEATLTLNGAADLTAGDYRLLVCGTTSLVNLIGVPLNDAPGTDTAFDFGIVAATAAPGAAVDATADAETAFALPATGFTPGVVTQLPAQPVDLAYASTDLMLSIPNLGVQIDIVGVPLVNGEWDVSWIGQQAGYLYGTAFPTWAGNTVITAHVWDANNNPGPFADLADLQFGDTIEILAFGQTYIYEVRDSASLRPTDRSPFAHSDYALLTLITCEGFDPRTGDYLFRRVVSAVLVEIR